MFFRKKKENLTTQYLSLFDIDAEDIDGNIKNLGEMAKGKKLTLVINVASKCFYANPNYKAMVELYNRYSEFGLEIFAFPSNQFMSQEYWSNEQIKENVIEKYGVQFPLFAKVDVNGEETHEVFKYVRRYSPLYDYKTKQIRSVPWNFTKFLINTEGKVVGYFSPADKKNVIEAKIQTILDVGIPGFTDSDIVKNPFKKGSNASVSSESLEWSTMSLPLEPQIITNN